MSRFVSVYLRFVEDNGEISIPALSHLQHARRVEIQHFAESLLIRREPAHCRQLLRPGALSAPAFTVTAVAAVQQLILMALEKLPRVILIAQ